MTHRRRIRRQRHRGKYRYHPVGVPRAHVRDREREGRRDDDFCGIQVERPDGYRAVGFLVGEESLGAEHSGPGRVDPPSDPTGGCSRTSEEGDGERGRGVVVGPVEGGVQGREVRVVSVGFVTGGNL